MKKKYKKRYSIDRIEREYYKTRCLRLEMLIVYLIRSLLGISGTESLVNAARKDYLFLDNDPGTIDEMRKKPCFR